MARPIGRRRDNREVDLLGLVRHPASFNSSGDAPLPEKVLRISAHHADDHALHLDVVRFDEDIGCIAALAGCRRILPPGSR